MIHHRTCNIVRYLTFQIIQDDLISPDILQKFWDVNSLWLIGRIKHNKIIGKHEIRNGMLDLSLTRTHKHKHTYSNLSLRWQWWSSTPHANVVLMAIKLISEIYILAGLLLGQMHTNLFTCSHWEKDILEQIANINFDS